MVVEGVHPLQRGQGAGERVGGVLEDPAGDYGVADGQGQGAQHRNKTQQTARLGRAETHFGGGAEGVHRAGARGPAEGHLTDDAGGTNDDHKNQIGDEKSGASVLGDAGGEEPDIAHSHGRTDAGQDKTPFGAPGVPLCAVCHSKSTPLPRQTG